MRFINSLKFILKRIICQFVTFTRTFSKVLQNVPWGFTIKALVVLQSQLFLLNDYAAGGYFGQYKMMNNIGMSLI